MITFYKIVTLTLLESLPPLLALRKQLPMLKNPAWKGAAGSLSSS